MILQGPHFGICNPFAKQPRATGRHQQDYESWDLETLPASLVPRTNWQRAASKAVFLAAVPVWNDKPSTSRYRVVARKMIPANTYRSIFASLLAPQPTTTDGCYTGVLSNDLLTTVFCGLMSSLVADYSARIAGFANLHDSVIRRFPMSPEGDALHQPIAHRVARLNCLTENYADLWETLPTGEWSEDDFTDPPVTGASIAGSSPTWNRNVAVRVDLERWLLLCELDALAALTFGLRVSGLEAIYRSQFPVLLGYEHQMLFDANGRQLCADWHQHGYTQARLEAEAKERNSRGWLPLWDRVEQHLDGDISVDLGPFKPPFRSADRVAAMTHAYWTFVERYDLTPPDIAERPS